MSVPHTGKLEAEITGIKCQFNGNYWITPVADLSARLNDATSATSKTHIDIRELAELVVRKCGLTANIISVQFDEWHEQIPDDAID